MATFKYSQTCIDVVSILRRKGFSVRSRLSSIAKGSTVGGVKRQGLERGTYLIHVDGHVLLINENMTLVDTDSRVIDRRKIKKIWLVKKLVS